MTQERRQAGAAMMRTRTGWSRRAILAVVALAVGLAMAGCGGSTGSAARNPSARNAAAQSAPATPGPPPASTATTVVPAGRGSAGGVCDLIRTYRQRLTALEHQGLGDPGRLRQFMSDIVAALDQAVGIASADVRPDLTLIRDATKQYDALLAKAGYDATRLTRDGDSPLLHADVQAASERQGVYAHDMCGVPD